MADYLKAYVLALARQQRREDEKIEERVEARLEELLDRLTAPQRQALELRARSEETRGRLHQMLARGDPPEETLPVALELIAELIGDEDFARYNRRYLEPGLGPPADAGVDQRKLWLVEYKALIGRIDSLVAHLGDGSLPQAERERALPQFYEMDERARALLALLDGDPQEIEKELFSNASEEDEIP